MNLIRFAHHADAVDFRGGGQVVVGPQRSLDAVEPTPLPFGNIPFPGVDDGVETESRVEVLIEGDGRELFRGQTGRKEPPRPLALDVRGVRDLRITVRSTGLLDFGAQASLADAKVNK